MGTSGTHILRFHSTSHFGYVLIFNVQLCQIRGGGRRRRSKQVLNGLMGTWSYWKLKEKALDRIFLKNLPRKILWTCHEAAYGKMLNTKCINARTFWMLVLVRHDCCSKQRYTFAICTPLISSLTLRKLKENKQAAEDMTFLNWSPCLLIRFSITVLCST
jgi:hypothetical protein